MIVSIIVAVARNNVIGSGGKMPWKIPGEQKRFRELSLGKTVFMGRRTFEEIGRPLPERFTVVISRTKKFEFANCITLTSFQEGFEKFSDEREIIIAGGAQLYKVALPYTDRIFMTRIHRDFPGDVFFPDWDQEDFVTTYVKRIEGKIPYTYYTFERKNKP